MSAFGIRRNESKNSILEGVDGEEDDGSRGRLRWINKRKKQTKKKSFHED